jgi:enoyl-CoA hydratase/carnithine racemase
VLKPSWIKENPIGKMPNEELLVEILECQHDTKVGHITLNSPETLNSLTMNMVNKISNLLDDWEVDPQIKMILVSGSGEKAFCAGGDIRALYESMCSPEGPVFAESFFESEYRLDYKLHNFSKPIISILDGIVMGGGAGLMFASTYKIATERTRFAMPEIGIGLFPDVGFTSLVKDLPEGLGLYIMLTATQLNAADMNFCNLTNGLLNSKNLDNFLLDILDINWEDEPAKNFAILDSLINKNSYSEKVANFPTSKVKEELDTIQSMTREDNLMMVVENIINNKSEDEWFTRGKESLKKGSPTSAHLIWLQHLNSSSLSLKEVFNFELNLAIQITRMGDFKEGIRALIIDKDNKPKWKYDSIKNVQQAWIDKHTDLAWEINPLEDL